MSKFDLATYNISNEQKEAIFEVCLDKVASGIPLKEALKDDIRGLNHGSILRWILRDEDRKRRYYEAQEMAAEMLASEMLEIADGKNDALEDVQRSALRIKTRRELMEYWDKGRFGQIKKIELDNKLTLKDAMPMLERAEQRILDVEAIVLDEEEVLTESDLEDIFESQTSD